MGDSQPFKLNCFLLGDDSYNPFPVEVSSNQTILELIDNVKKAYDILASGTLIGIDLYKTDVSSENEELAKLELPSQSDLLKRFRRAKFYWKDPNNIDEDRVHILVKADVVPVLNRTPPPKHETIDPLSSLAKGIKELSLRQDKTAEGFRNAPSASTAAGYTAFGKQQATDDIPIYNGRPHHRTEVPIQLLHPAFDLFETKLNQSIGLVARDYQVVENLLLSSQELYDAEDSRWNAMKGYLSALTGHPILVDPISNCQSDGVIVFTEKYSVRKAYGVVIDVKNEIGTGDSDPWVQGAQAYARYWSQTEMTEMRLATRCPSLIISIAGPWMCVSGAVYLDHVVVQPLTEYVWLGTHPQRDNRLIRMTQLFNAISQTIAALQDYYIPFITKTSSLPIDYSRFFPHINCIPRPDGPLEFAYTERMGDPKIIQPVYEATTKDDSAIVVKFAQSYNFEAHRLLAEQSLAPTLLSHNEERVSGGLFMIVTQLSGTSLDNFLINSRKLEPTALDQVRKDVKKALEILHEKNLVFGDLRPPNVLITRANDGTLRGQLVDFDWCGIEGEAHYPVGMNESRAIGWATGVEKGSPLSKLHDQHMYEKLFRES